MKFAIWQKMGLSISQRSMEIKFSERESRFPIWKKGFIISEFGIHLPIFFIFPFMFAKTFRCFVQTKQSENLTLNIGFTIKNFGK